MKEQIDTLTSQFNNSIAQNPHYGWLIVAFGLALLCVGYILRWKWVINPEGRTRSVVLYEMLGVETMRIIMIAATALVTLICVGAFFLASHSKVDKVKTLQDTEIQE